MTTKRKETREKEKRLDNSNTFCQNLSQQLDEEGWFHLVKMAEMGLSAASVVHEVRQPLSSLKMALQLMREESDRSKAIEEYYKNSLEQIERIERLLDQVRDFLRPGFQNRTEVNIPALIEGVVLLLKGNFGSNRIMISFEAEPEIAPLFLERFKIEQIFFNLLANARDAVLENGGGRIYIRISKGKEGGVDVVVGDDGPGIDPSLSEKVFEPFYSTKNETHGTGLGLYIAMVAANQHNATIELLDEKQRQKLKFEPLSTAFRVSFSNSNKKKPQSNLPISSIENTGRVLVVDDDEAFSKMLKKAIEKEGFICQTSVNGEQAVSCMEKETVDLVITELNLRGISGLDVARTARNMDPSMPVLLITGNPSKSSADDAAKIGVEDYIVKPLDIDKLALQIQKLAKRDIGMP